MVAGLLAGVCGGGVMNGVTTVAQLVVGGDIAAQ